MTIKVILTKQIPKLGNPGDVISVAPGYARNFLFPGALAQEATPDALARAAASKRKKATVRERRTEERSKLHGQLGNKEILVKAKANEAGNLFGGVGAQEIADAIEKRKKITIDPKQIMLPHHLKVLGKHQLVLQLGAGDSLSFTVDIQRAEQ